MNKKGFSLIELLIVILISILIMAAVYGTMDMAQHSSSTLGSRVATQQDTRAVLDLMTMEIRMASYGPPTVSGTAVTTWQAFDPTQTNPCVANPVAANKGIQYANANSIAIEMDLNNPPDGLVTGTNELIYYSYDSSKSAISRQVGCSGPLTTILGGTTGTDTKVVNYLTVPVTPLFRYYDITDTEIPSANIADKSRIKDIRRIAITIVADTTYTDARIKSVNRMIYSTSFIVRNHVI
jgi:prepilin-type N-terminal cleavage/methylation domain-containing protein